MGAWSGKLIKKMHEETRGEQIITDARGCELMSGDRCRGANEHGDTQTVGVEGQNRFGGRKTHVHI